MRVCFESNPGDHFQACEQLEALAEGFVAAMVEELDAAPEGVFPCCIKCGGFCTRNGPLTPAQAQAIQFTLEHGHPRATDRSELEGVLSAHGWYMPDDADAASEVLEVGHVGYSATTRNQDPFGYEACAPRHQQGRPAPHGDHTITIRSARQILETRGGTTLELAVYQAAQKRRHADPGAIVKVLCTAPGTFRAVVLCSELHEKPERRGAIDDPVEDAKPAGSCGCSHPETEEEHAQAEP
jgi:hypothetical protein